MAYGIEVHFGYTSDQFAKVQEALGLKTDLFEIEERDLAEGDAEILQSLSEKLKVAYRKALNAAGFTVLAEPKENPGDFFDGYWKVETPAGERTMSSFGLTLNYDPGEMGHTEEDATFGVDLSGRYKPTFLDYRDRSGALSVVNFSDPLIEIATKAIVEEIPELADASVLVVEKHY